MTPGNAGTLDMLNRGEIAMGPVWVDMFYTWQAEGKLNPKVKLALPSPGLPGQPMYYVIPAKAANAALAKKFIDFAESPEIQADGIVKQFNWYPGHRPAVRAGEADARGVEQALRRHHAGRPREERAPVPAVGLLHRHRRGVRARRAEVMPAGRAFAAAPAAPHPPCRAPSPRTRGEGSMRDRVPITWR